MKTQKFREVDYARAVDYLEGKYDLKDISYLLRKTKGGSSYAYLLKVLREMYRHDLLKWSK